MFHLTNGMLLFTPHETRGFGGDTEVWGSYKLNTTNGPLAHLLADAPRVEPLLYGVCHSKSVCTDNNRSTEHLDKAITSQEKAFKDDPMHLYLSKTPVSKVPLLALSLLTEVCQDERKKSKVETRIVRLIYKRIISHQLKFVYAFTVGGGDAGALA